MVIGLSFNCCRRCIPLVSIPRSRILISITFTPLGDIIPNVRASFNSDVFSKFSLLMIFFDSWSIRSIRILVRRRRSDNSQPPTTTTMLLSRSKLLFQRVSPLLLSQQRAAFATGPAAGGEISDDLLQKLGSLSTQALVDGLWVMGWPSSQIDAARPLAPSMKCVGRAVTLRFVPARPDIVASKPPVKPHPNTKRLKSVARTKSWS
jgi:hypothetical protein